MKLISAVILLSLTMLAMTGCSMNRANTPAMKDTVKQALQQAGFPRVHVYEDRGKGVITIRGNVNSQEEKDRAETTARRAAGPDVVANELLVVQGDKSHARNVAIATDDAINARFKELAQKERTKHVRGESINGVLTLTGSVGSTAEKTRLTEDSKNIAGVNQVIDQLEVKPVRHARLFSRSH